jgi:hypothetical protein
MELALRIVLLVIGVGGAIVTAAAAPRSKKWRIPLIGIFAVLGVAGLVLTIVTYVRPNDTPIAHAIHGDCNQLALGNNNKQQLDCSKHYRSPPRSDALVYVNGTSLGRVCNKIIANSASPQTYTFTCVAVNGPLPPATEIEYQSYKLRCAPYRADFLMGVLQLVDCQIIGTIE